jgi:renalase
VLTAPVTVVGAGMAGAACAVGLRAAGVPVRIIERGPEVGGRLASRQLHGRPVDLGAAYLTARDPGFLTVVQDWQARGLARPWTDTFTVLNPGRPASSTSGPLRWVAPGGFRSLVTDLIERPGSTAGKGNIDGWEVLQVRTGDEVRELPPGTVVLAMPDPQAQRLVPLPDAVLHEPTLTLACGFQERDWAFEHAAFVNDHPVLTFVADDGARRGDGAAVLVAHSSADFARRHLSSPDSAVPALVAALRDLVGVGAPAWTYLHRWSFAKPAASHRATHGFTTAADGRQIGLAGDQWCPQGAPRVESAWRSGTELAKALARIG